MTEAFPSICFTCVACGHRTTSRICCLPQPLPFWTCKRCQYRHAFKDFVRAYGFPVPKNKFNEFCTEFTCECGIDNTVFIMNTTILIKSDNPVPGEEWKRELSTELVCKIETGESPQYGVCEGCGFSQKLVTPLDERTEKSLRKSGFPFNGNSAELDKWYAKTNGKF